MTTRGVGYIPANPVKQDVRINLDLIERIDLEDGMYVVYIGGVIYHVHDRKAFDKALGAPIPPLEVRVLPDA
jgi:hypothetical protein